MNKLYRPFQPTITDTGLQRFGLSLQQVPAGHLLRNVVHSYLQVRAVRPTPYPSIPDGTQAIFISPHGSRVGGALIQPCDIPILQPGDYFGIRFYPGALRLFFNLDLSDITDQLVDHTYLPCRLFNELHDRIYELQGFDERAQLCERWLLQHYEPRAATPFDQALSLIYQAFGNIKVSQLAAMVGWSSRHLNRMFQLHTGLNTKTFAQTIRVQHACRDLFAAPADSLAAATRLGYFDQAHLLNDFKKRFLSSPGVFFARFRSDFSNS